MKVITHLQLKVTILPTRATSATSIEDNQSRQAIPVVCYQSILFMGLPLKSDPVDSRHEEPTIAQVYPRQDLPLFAPPPFYDNRTIHVNNRRR